LTRKEAVGIALEAGQVDPEHCSSLGLMSENLWIIPEDSALSSQEARHRQEMEEAKRERDNWKAEFNLLFGVARSDAQAAEQREREAGEREKVLREALEKYGRHTRDCIRKYWTQSKVCRCGLAAIRSAPPPVPVTRTPLQGEGGRDAQAHDGESETAAPQDRGDEAELRVRDGVGRGAGVRARAAAEVGHDRANERLSAPLPSVRDACPEVAATSPVSAPPTEEK
jgi:hypothetical protein